jgi:hypothetical protein
MNEENKHKHFREIQLKVMYFAIQYFIKNENLDELKDAVKELADYFKLPLTPQRAVEPFDLVKFAEYICENKKGYNNTLKVIYHFLNSLKK